MIKFERYSHINDLIQHYITASDNKHISRMMEIGVLTEDDAIKFSEFIWKIVEKINGD